MNTPNPESLKGNREYLSQTIDHYIACGDRNRGLALLSFLGASITTAVTVTFGYEGQNPWTVFGAAFTAFNLGHGAIRLSQAHGNDGMAAAAFGVLVEHEVEVSNDTLGTPGVDLQKF